MLLVSAMALGLVETQNPNAVGGGGGVGGSSGGGAATTEIRAPSNGWDNATLRSAVSGDWTFDHCQWRRPHHLYFQLGNAFFFMAFLAPHRSYGMLWLRCACIVGSVFMLMWGWTIECASDVALWSGIFLVTNFVYLIALISRLRPVRFDKEIEAVYSALFKPLHVSRHQFKLILNCMKLVRSLKYQEVYAQEKVTKVDSLSLVLAGKLVVSQNQRALHIVFPHQFLDSPEWFGVSTDDYFQVSIMAMEESRVLIWHRDKLKLSIMTEPFLQTVFDHILGRDVVKKLMQVTQVSETMASASCNNGFLPSSMLMNNGYNGGLCGNEDTAEDKPMLLKSSSKNGNNDGGGHGITALINRQLQVEEHVPLLLSGPSTAKFIIK